MGRMGRPLAGRLSCLSVVEARPVLQEWTQVNGFLCLVQPGRLGTGATGMAPTPLTKTFTKRSVTIQFMALYI